MEELDEDEEEDEKYDPDDDAGDVGVLSEMGDS